MASFPEMRPFYRIVQEVWADTAMTGEGARRFGGRWNPPGLAAVYLAESRALAALEVIVHAPKELMAMPWVLIEVHVPEDLIQVSPEIPEDWQIQPYSPSARRLGETWLREANATALDLPSSIIPEERVILLNPGGSQISRLLIGKPSKFRFDPRLV